MSTHDFAFGDHENGPDPVFGGLDRFNDRELEERILDLEPKAREINRALADLFGARRDGEPWAYLGQGDDDIWRVYVTPIEMTEVLHLVARIGRITADAEPDAAVKMSCHYDAINLAHRVIGEAARFRTVPSTHVKIVRGR